MTNPNPKINGTRRAQLHRELTRVMLTDKGRALLHNYEQLRGLTTLRRALTKHFPNRR